MSKKHTKLLINIWKAADFLEGRCRMNANNLLAPKYSRQKAGGQADAYAHIKQMIVDQRVGAVDYYDVFKVVKDIPNILKE